MKILLIVWTICSMNPEYINFEKSLKNAMESSEDTANSFLDKELIKAYKSKDYKKLVFITAVYHTWKCEMPKAALDKMPASLSESSSLEDLVKLVEKEIE
jgi:hypothetical protein